ncbi:MAG: M14 family zinc carboxypeptidase [Thermoplasmata archaeon]
MRKKAVKFGVFAIALVLLVSVSANYVNSLEHREDSIVSARVYISSLNDLNTINNMGGNVILREGTSLLVEGKPSIFSSLEAKGMLVYILGNSTFSPTIQGSEYPFPDHYPSVSELYSWYDDLEVEYPNLISKINIGQSYEGRDLWVLEVTSDEDTQVDYKPGFLVDGNMHAREWSGNQVSAYFMWRLLNEYDTNETIHWLVNNRRIYVMPMQNPDGYTYDGDGGVGSGNNWRKNRNDSIPDDAVGVDLNRNWDIMWESGNDDPRGGDYHGEAPFSEYENWHERDFILDNSIDSYQNIHSYAGTLLIPLCYSSDPSPHDDWYRGMASHMTSLSSRMGDENSHYSYGQPHETIGYSAPGGAGDWTYDALGIQSLVFEIETGGGGFYPGTDDIMTINQDVDDSLIYQARVSDVDLGDGTNHLFPPVPYILYGNVEDTGGSPVTDVPVTLENVDTQETLSINTDMNGYYELNYGNLVDHGYEPSDSFTVSVETSSVDFSIGDEWGQRIDIEFTMEGDPPEISLTRPNGGETFTAGTEEEITWETTEGDDPIDSLDLWYRTDPGSSWISVASGIPDSGSYTWLVPNVHSTDCMVRARVRDQGERTAEDMSDSVFTIQGILPSPPLNLNVEHCGADEILENPVFQDNYEPWELTRVEDGGEARWDNESYMEGGSIYIVAEAVGEENISTEESYWEQDINPTSDELTISAAFRKYIEAESAALGSAQVNHSVVEVLVHDTDLGWQTVHIDEDTSDGDSGWNEFEPAVYTPEGYVDAVRASMHVEAEGNTVLTGDLEARGELWMDQISVSAQADEGTEDNLISWDASPDDPDTVSHYNVYRSESDIGPWDTPITSIDAVDSASYSYLDPGTGTGDDILWWYVVRAVGTNGLEEENEQIVPEPGSELSTFEIPLFAGGESGGWNFVSFNLIPVDSSLDVILDGITGSYDRVMYFDASTGMWHSYMPGRPSHFNNLQNWNHRIGIWIRMTKNDTLTIEGTIPTSTTITLKPGWNMVGMPSESTGNHGLPEEVTCVGYFSGDEESNIAYTETVSAFEFEPGKGYWVYNDASESVYWNVV